MEDSEGTMPERETSLLHDHWAKVKLARARTHVRSLLTWVDTWTTDNPYWVDIDYADDRHRADVVLRVRVPPPTQPWSVIVGDFVHNVRSALDSTVWELAG